MPTFSNLGKNWYSDSVPENIELHSPLSVQIQATSPMSRKLIYSIVKGNELEEFAVDFNTGMLRFFFFFILAFICNIFQVFISILATFSTYLDSYTTAKISLSRSTMRWLLHWFLLFDVSPPFHLSPVLLYCLMVHDKLDRFHHEKGGWRRCKSQPSLAMLKKGIFENNK